MKWVGKIVKPNAFKPGFVKPNVPFPLNPFFKQVSNDLLKRVSNDFRPLIFKVFEEHQKQWNIDEFSFRLIAGMDKLLHSVNIEKSESRMESLGYLTITNDTQKSLVTLVDESDAFDVTTLLIKEPFEIKVDMLNTKGTSQNEPIASKDTVSEKDELFFADSTLFTQEELAEIELDFGVDPRPFTKEEEKQTLAHYQEMYPGFTKEYFVFLLKYLDQFEIMHFGATRNIIDHQKSFGCKTLVYTRQELYTHLISRGYRTELVTFLTQNACEELIPHWTVSQWSLAFLMFAENPWESVVASGKGLHGYSNSPSTTTPSTLIPHSNDDQFKAWTTKLEKIKTESDHRVLFHFTIQQYASSIQVDGINMRYSSKFTEFATTGAFYLCDSVPYGLNWLQTRYPGEKWSVLIFEVPDEYYQGVKFCDLKNGGEEWQRFCHYHFNQGYDKIVKHRLEREHEVIIGPICESRVIGESPKVVKPFTKYGGLCIQHAIIKQPAADRLMFHLTMNLNLE